MRSSSVSSSISSTNVSFESLRNKSINQLSIGGGKNEWYHVETNLNPSTSASSSDSELDSEDELRFLLSFSAVADIDKAELEDAAPAAADTDSFSVPIATRISAGVGASLLASFKESSEAAASCCICCSCVFRRIRRWAIRECVGGSKNRL